VNRRGFLTRSGLALGALIVGDEALALAERLTHRKVWALGAVSQPWHGLGLQFDAIGQDAKVVPIQLNARFSFRLTPPGYRHIVDALQMRTT
jgi:hypothetical protein